MNARRREAILGKSDTLKACEEAASGPRDVKTTFTRFKVMTTDDCVVVDSQAEYVGDDGESSHVAPCDIYEFTDGNGHTVDSRASYFQLDELRRLQDGRRLRGFRRPGPAELTMED